MKRYFKRFAFWFGVFSFLLFTFYLIYETSWTYNLLGCFNYPLFAFLNLLLPEILHPFADGLTYTGFQVFTLRLPYGVFYVLTYIGYGALIDWILNLRKHREHTT